ncbi:SDR family NAD(P)-dependent oxidoreductase [Mesobacillus maritimus]|uniref:SDR family NAD(P)-dependent oxidoreductase n=1 Tax=Mesobacillus maritimus TaxID=1643336 RepID=UPI00203F329E|nr:SDR family NAD(P)-dependent oxidoreductase [Mesobacillus maritimus]MCM3671007.1 SDR family NAD(P)-dependent oxidoreductase [Mesobacillus maritimus]
MKVFEKVIVVTGAGGGIGRELVSQLLEKGAKVAAIIHKSGLEDIKSLATIYGDNISTHIANLANREDVEKLPEEIISVHGCIDGMINNAGIIQPFHSVNDLDYEQIQRVMDVNFYGTLYMCKSFLPYLLDRPEAHITNVSSMGGFLPVPLQSIYCASKAAVKMLTEGLHLELRNTNVGVTIVFPGGVDTNLVRNAGIEIGKVDKHSYKMLSPIDAAAIIIKGMENNQYRVLAGNDAKIMDFLYRLNPKKATSIIAKKITTP